MRTLSGYVYVIEWEGRRNHYIFGKGDWMIEKLGLFRPCETVFDARTKQLGFLKRESSTQSIGCTYISELEFAAAENIDEEMELAECQKPLVVVSVTHRPDLRRFLGSGGNLMRHLRPYVRREAALHCLEWERKRYGCSVMLASWVMRRVHTHHAQSALSKR